MPRVRVARLRREHPHAAAGDSLDRMVIFYCCGCRAQYPAQPKRCPRCKGRSFSAVNDDAPTAGLVDAGGAVPFEPENLDPDLARAFAASERHRLTSLGLAVPVYPALTSADDAPPTPRDMPERSDD